MVWLIITYVNRNEITKNFQYEAPDFPTKKDECSSPSSLYSIDSSPSTDPYKTPPVMKKSMKNAAQWHLKRAEYFNSQGIDYYNSHSGVSPPDEEETENDREDDEDVEDTPARKSSRR